MPADAEDQRQRAPRAEPHAGRQHHHVVGAGRGRHDQAKRRIGQEKVGAGHVGIFGFFAGGPIVPPMRRRVFPKSDSVTISAVKAAFCANRRIDMNRVI
jgi:hypothetical protein